ncbi:DUF2235 domain-containing protein [Roseicyclus sp.]|uniref:DUF2235 domain-containing protein n=1 Tax=Roseicyclus sp. TaxID=1914329 RepID=UPI003F6A8353
MTHVVLLDGTMSRLTRGEETNIGLTFRLLRDLSQGTDLSVYYEPGIQWRSWRRTHEVLAGIGLNRQIKRAYLFLARGYRPGDKIFLMGYSRGAYAVRSLAGMIDRLGLLLPERIDRAALERLYTLYREAPGSEDAQRLKQRLCHPETPIDFLGAYDTVRALGLGVPGLWQIVPAPHPFHNNALGPNVRAARHALALEETRDAFRPMIWKTTPEQAESGQVQQLWFRGSHGDVGGHLGGLGWARPLANIPLVWMLAEAEGAGLPLPVLWRQHYITDADAQGIGMNRGVGVLFLRRTPRPVGQDRSEALHPSAAGLGRALGMPRLRIMPS